MTAAPVVSSRALAVEAARAASAKQARDVVVMEMRDLLVITDYFVVAGGTSDRQVRTVAEEIERALRERGVKPVRREGEREGRWVLLDYVDLVVHVFLDEEREFYDLERLWADAPRVGWEHAGAVSNG
ncbi:MAG TPA: ribosome silencing factor [Actinomycetota bacterium]|nr:ribosome silencing factor [Actinomycetota bacterium]